MWSRLSWWLWSEGGVNNMAVGVVVIVPIVVVVVVVVVDVVVVVVLIVVVVVVVAGRNAEKKKNPIVFNYDWRGPHACLVRNATRAFIA